MKRALLAIGLVLGGHAHAQQPRPHLELPQQSLTDGDKVRIGPIAITSSRAERDSRPLMIGGSIVVLAAVMWWNRKRRERFDRDEEVARPSRATTESREDTNDLQAAARGDREET